MKNPTAFFGSRHGFVIVLPLLLLGLAPVSTFSAAEPLRNDELVTLPEFSVRAEQDGSYDAPDSLIGSRVKTEIRNLPYNLNVVTAEFIRDFAAFNIDEELAYTSSFSQGQSNDTEYTLRGISVQNQLRNGFRAEVLRGTVNTERVEVIKGPAAAIYGQAQPGGVINTVTKRPKTTFGGNVRASFGNYDQRRGEVELTGPLAAESGRGLFRNTYALFTLANYYRTYEQDYTFTDQLQGSLTLTKKFSPDTALTFETEYIYIDSRRREAIPFNQETIAGRTLSTGLAIDLFNFYANTPDATTERKQGVGYLTFEHRFNHAVSMRTAANYGQARAFHFNYVGTNMALANPRRIGTAREPEHATQGRYTYGLQSDWIVRYRTRGLEHQTLATLDFASIRTTRSNVRLPTNLRNNPAFNIATLLVESPNYFLLPYSPANYPRVNTANDNLTEIYGAFVRHQISAFRGRLIAMGGLRYDYTAFDLKDKTTAVPAEDVYHADAITPQIGVNYRFTDDFIVYANRSESFIPPTSSGSATNINSGVRFKNEEGLGYEVGIKGSLFQQQLNFTLATYHIDRENVRTTEVELLPLLDSGGLPVIDSSTGQPVLTSQAIARTEGLERSKGIEFDFNWKVARALQLFGSFGYSDSFIVRAGRDLDAIGRRPRSSPAYRTGGGIRAALPKHILNGMVLTLGITYTGEAPILAPTSGGTASPDGFIRAHNGQRDILIPSYIVWNAGASYRFRTERQADKRLDHRIQVNLKNLFDRKYIATDARAADRFTIVGGYSVGF
jgi:iron complex outermembrane recepter protein